MANVNAIGAGAAGSAGSVKKAGDPEADAKEYAKLKGIPLDQAKKELQAMHGDPQQGGAKGLNDNSSYKKVSVFTQGQ